MTTAHNENHMTDFFSAQEFPRRVNTLEILQQAEQHRAQELARLGAAFGRFVRRTVISPIVVAYQRQRMYEELSQLSDRVLEDIGVSRGNIAQVVADSFPGQAEQKAETANTTLHSLVAKRRAQAAQTVSNDQTHRPLAA